MFCKYCGTELLEDSLYCNRCGTPVDQYENTQNTVYYSDIYYTNDTQASAYDVGLEENADKKKSKLGMIVGSVILLLVGFFLVQGICLGVGGNWGLFDRNGREIKSISKDEDTRTYRVTSDTEVTEEQMEDLLYKLQLRADSSIHSYGFIRDSFRKNRINDTIFYEKLTQSSFSVII